MAYLDHQRVILNVDNSALNQRIAALAQDKLFKDAHCEALKKEVQRLRQLYQQQHMQKEVTTSQPGAFDVQQQQFAKLDGGTSRSMDPKPDATDSSSNLLKKGAGISESKENNAANNHNSSGCQMLKSMMSSSCLIGENHKSLEDRMMAGMPSDYMVHNP